jgi:hypothetical protein
MLRAMILSFLIFAVILTFTELRFIVISRTTQNEAHGGGTGSKVAFSTRLVLLARAAIWGRKYPILIFQVK